MGEKREFQIIELDKVKLKAVVLLGGFGKDVHMTQPVGFIAASSISVA